MKKKILSLFVAICMIFPMAFSLVACDDTDKDSQNQASKQSTMAAENITLSYESTVYDGTEKKPHVTLTYGDETISSENYTVEYDNNIDAGTATVVVKSKADSAVLDANLEFSTTFEIKRASISASSFAELTSAIQITDKNHVITLTDNIEMVRDASNGNKVVPVLIYPQKNQDIAIDLNGYDVNSYLRIVSDLKGLAVSGAYYGFDAGKPAVSMPTDKTVKLNIFNSSNAESVFGFASNEADYAIILKTDNDYDIDFNNVTFKGYWGAITSNGLSSSNTTVNAEDCKFIGTKVTGANYDDVSIGAYMASGKVVYSYENCHFEGFTGYYAKSGHHYFSNCTVKAVGDDAFEKLHYGNGCYATGSALVIDSCVGYNTVPSAGYQKALTIDISGGRFVSKSKHAIEEFSTYKVPADRISYAFVNIADEVILTSTSGYKAMSFENADAYHTHTYTNDSDSSCNDCGANRKVFGEDLWFGKTGTLPTENDNVIVISTANELAALAAAVNAGNTFAGKTIELACDINLNNIEWTPIGFGAGSGSNPFCGTFDGKGYKVSNLRITNFIGGGTNAGTSKGVGLFGNIDNPAVIKNVNIDGTRVDGNHFVGALVGFASYADISNCVVKNATINCTYADTDESGDKAGAVIGHVSNTTATNCNAENSIVKAGRDAGQVFGCLAGKTTIKNISATAVIVSSNGTGTGAYINNTVVGRDNATISSWDGIVGTLPEAVENVITINDVSELAALAKAVNEGNNFSGYTIKLNRNMNLNNIEWTPIGFGAGSGSNPFCGTFDGQNKTIYNLKVTTFIGGGTNAGTSKGVGLFGNIDNPAVIKNVNIDGARVDGNHFVGALVGFASYADISNCVVKNATINCTYADTDESGDKAGAVIGHVSNTTATNCRAENSIVKAGRDAGQLFGCLAGTTTYTGCTVTSVSVSSNGTGTGMNVRNEVYGRDNR